MYEMKFMIHLWKVLEESMDFYKSTIKSQKLLLLFIIVIITTTPAVINDIETVQCIKLWTTVDSEENTFSWFSHYCLTPAPEVANSSAVKDVYQMDEEKWFPPLWSNLPEQIVTTAEKCLWQQFCPTPPVRRASLSLPVVLPHHILSSPIELDK